MAAARADQIVSKYSCLLIHNCSRNYTITYAKNIQRNVAVKILTINEVCVGGRRWRSSHQN